MHYSNLMAGANFGITSLQVFYAFGIGMIFAAVLIRTGNLWPCIIVHGLIDTLAMMSDEAMDTGMVQTQTFSFS